MEEKIKPSPSYKAELQEAKRKTAKSLLWVGIIGMVMFWAGLTSAYIVRADNGNWLIFKVPDIFIISTAIIITSSLTLFYSYISARKNNFLGVNLGLLFTLILGFAFVYCQYNGWKELFYKGIVFGGKTSNASGSFFILFIFAHWAHLIGGIISLIVTLVKGLKRKYNAGNTLGLELCSIYWHFLDILWVYLFLFLYYIR